MGMDWGESSKVSTGIPLLDDILKGGIFPGSVVCFIADPMSMVEVFLYQMASVRKTYYFTTTRHPEYIKRNMEDLDFDLQNVEFVDVYSKFNPIEEKDALSLPTVRKNIYNISRHHAERSTRLFTNSANMPKDLFWKFEFWSKEKAITVLGDISKKIFSDMMSINSHSSMVLIDVDPKNYSLVVQFDECDECTGLSNAKNGVCCYHAGISAGIFSSLLRKDFDAYETNCHALGNENCVFNLGIREKPIVQASLESYLNPPTSISGAIDREFVDVSKFMQNYLRSIEKDTNIIIDTFSFFLETSQSKEKIRHLVNQIYEITNKIGGVTVFYILNETHEKGLEQMIINTCDVVFELETQTLGNEIETTIAIPKTRGAVSPNKKIKVLISDRVMVDTTRGIA